MGRPESGTKLEEWDELVAMIKRKFRSRPDYLAMAARVEDEYIFPMRDASTNKRHVARDLKKLEKETDEGAQRPDFRRHQTAGGSPDGKRGQGRGGCPVPEVHEGLCSPRGSI